MSDQHDRMHMDFMLFYHSLANSLHYGSNINVDENGNVTGIVDAKGVLEAYRGLCAAEGKSCDKLIVIGE